MRVKDIFSRDPNVHSGDLVFAGTRVPVENLVDYLKGGYSLDRFLRGFPSVERRQAEAFLELGFDQIKDLMDEQLSEKQPQKAHARAH